MVRLLLYSTVTALVFARLYFPRADPFVGTLEAFGVYAVGFVARPIGAALFGFCDGDDPGIVRGLRAVEPSSVPGTGADAHGDSGCRGTACAEHLLAIFGVAASGGGAATAGGGAAD